MTKRLAGKVAVVTGAGRNIGREEALALSREGASILVNDVANAQETAELIRAEGGKAAVDTHSASSWSSGEAIIAAALGAFGRIDILINNAGITRARPIDQMTEEEWDAVIDVSLKGYAATIRFAAPHFIAQRSGIIINTGSTSGLGHIGMANYSAAKEGALGLTRTVARDLGQYGVRCNLIRPINHITNTATPEVISTIELNARLGLPLNGARHMAPHAMPLAHHVAALAVLLCLPASAHVSGQDFFIQGEEVGRFREPELIGLQFQPEGWTLQTLEQPHVVDNLLGDIRNRYIRES